MDTAFRKMSCQNSFEEIRSAPFNEVKKQPEDKRQGDISLKMTKSFVIFTPTPKKHHLCYLFVSVCVRSEAGIIFGWVIEKGRGENYS